MVLVTVQGVYQDPENRYFVLLQSAETKLKLPIWIGQCEAMHISQKLVATETDAPLTFDVVGDILAKTQVKISYVLISDGNGSTFDAICKLQNTKEDDEIKSRPSDAIALALSVNVPIYLSKEILDEYGRKA